VPHPTALPAVILAGGLSRRMGTDKSLLNLGGKPLALRIADRLAPQVSEVRLNAEPGHPLSGLLPIAPDTRADRPGPMAGVLAGMKVFAELPKSPTHVLTVPCDTPFLPDNLVLTLADKLEENTIVMAASAGRTHPVTALWPIALVKDLEAWLKDPANRRVFDFVARHRSRTVEFETLTTASGQLDPFFNINTPEDLAIAEAMIAGGVP